MDHSIYQMYTKHLMELNRENPTDDQEAKDNDREGVLCAVCPITQSNMDATDPASAISIITNTQTLSLNDKVILKTMGFLIPLEKEVVCHHVDTYDLESAYQWFVVNRGVHPLSRRVLTVDERNRIKFRAEMRDQIRIEVSDSEIHKMFSYYTENIHNMNSETHIMLRCHLVPEKLPNYFDFTREEAQEYLRKSKITWVARPSKFKGYEFAKDANSQFYPMVEYTAITSYDSATREFRHDLIEKFFSRGYYRGGGQWYGDDFDLERAQGAPCFFDVLHNVMKQIHTQTCDIRVHVPYS